MKVESLILASVAICLFLTFYFSYLSFQTTEDQIKKQFTLLATFSLIAGMVLLASIAIYIIIKKAFTHVEDQLIISQETAQYYEEEQQEKEREN
jgi:membrane protein insertase Oxa1/YidC/SpoIIIJ